MSEVPLQDLFLHRDNLRIAMTLPEGQQLKNRDGELTPPTLPVGPNNQF
jgi:hypothetical protein